MFNIQVYVRAASIWYLDGRFYNSRQQREVNLFTEDRRYYELE